jgi:hypothetical protein
MVERSKLLTLSHSAGKSKYDACVILSTEHLCTVILSAAKDLQQGLGLVSYVGGFFTRVVVEKPIACSQFRNIAGGPSPKAAQDDRSRGAKSA